MNPVAIGNRINHHAWFTGAWPNQIDPSRGVCEIDVARQRARIDQAGQISEVDTGARHDGIKAMFIHLLSEAFSLHKIGNSCFHVCQLSNARVSVALTAAQA